MHACVPTHIVDFLRVLNSIRGNGKKEEGINLYFF